MQTTLPFFNGPHTENAPEIALQRSPLTAGIDRARNTSAYHRRLVERLGRGADWIYEGECNDLGAPIGKCCCGHEAIRYEFTIHHPDGRRAVLGSSCIESYPGISPEVLGAVERDLFRLEEEAKAREKRAREIAQDAEIVKLCQTWNGLLWQLDEIIASTISYNRPDGRRVARELWATGRTAYSCNRRLEQRQRIEVVTHPKVAVKQYKLKSACIKWLQQQIKTTASFIADPWEHD